MPEYSGNRWYKCDLHLHTMSSKCYLDKENTVQQWVERALEQGLDVVAVTDHNDYRGITPVTEEAAKRGLSVFPGVEITCDSAKIHMLILFDTSKTAENVRDFLNRCDIESDQIGDADGTNMSVFEVCEIAKKRGALVIAAHIDEFSSISSMNPSNLEKLLTGGYIDAVQVANKDIWKKYNADKDADAMIKTLQEKYGPDATFQETDRWRKCYMRALELGLPMLEFSDNPASENDSHHGLWGIGSEYTWIQMDDVVNLESIRQSLLNVHDRIRLGSESIDEPFTEPDFWIRSLTVRKTGLNPHKEIRLDFHPQLNCIIGGRGSGKSSVVKLLQGVYALLSDNILPGTFSSQKRFYAPVGDDGVGIFREDSEISIEFSWFGEPCRMLVTDIRGIGDQTVRFYRTDPETGKEEPLLLYALLLSPVMRPQVFIQRQINETAVTPGALLSLVDSCIYDMHILKARREYALGRLVNLSAQLETEKRFSMGKDRVEAELMWLENLTDLDAVPSGMEKASAQMIERRKEAAAKLEECAEHIEVMQKARETLLEEYKRSLEQIYLMRKQFISEVLADDENYKFELSHMASRDSLHKMLREMFAGNADLISGDAKKLEEALFAKKDGIRKYTDLLLLARGRNTQEGSEDAQEAFSSYFIHRIRNLNDSDFERMLLFRPEDEISMFHHPNGIKRFFPMTTASSGEKSTAVFSLILFSRNVPLVIDQPEDDIDNRVIYEELVPKLKRAKQNRQLIIVTHNANIATNADAEKIISMDSWSKFVSVRMQGSVDNDDIRREICDIIEGSEAAFMHRAKKYHIGQ